MTLIQKAILVKNHFIFGKRPIFFITLLMLLILHSVNAEEKEQLHPPPVMPKVHPLAENLVKIGAFSCAERANQIANFLAGGAQTELVIQTPKDNPNSRMLMSTVVIPLIDKQTVTANINLAPNQVNGCGGSYHTVAYSNAGCKQVIAESYPSTKFQLINKTSILIGVVNRALWIMAIPAGTGCVITKDEVLE